jgi:alkanesulfonate monooxygenase SsuD/methylene tetrahydromethanopterin reductase-like flavin-dependent oxidoreductase (luciferase family)
MTATTQGMPTATSTHRPLKVGIQLPEVERVVRWPELLAMARLAESIGLDSLWTGDHLLYRDADGATSGPWEAWTTLAAIAAVTERVEIGPLVASAGFHSPQMLAKMAASVDEISGGRLIVGLGSGWNEPDYRAFGFPYDQRVSRFEEAFDIIRRLLAGETVDHEGRFYEAQGSVLLPASSRPGGPPLMIGSIGERMLRITLPHVAAWNIWFDAWHNDPRELPGLMDWLDRQCEQVGRDPGTLVRTVAVLVGLTGGSGRRHGGADRIEPLTGGAEAIADGLRDIATAGISHVQLVLDPITTGAIEELAPVLELLDRS